MFSSRYVLACTTTALASTAVALAPATRKSRRKRKGSDSKTKSKSLGAAVPRTAAAVPSRLTNGGETTREESADLDEVERLLAATPTTISQNNSTAATAAQLSSTDKTTSSLSTAHNTNTDDLVSGSGAAAMAGVVDPSSAVHFRAVQAANAVDSATTASRRGGPTHAQLEQIDRRRSKVSVAEAEFEMGVTERLVPELPRLPALHEVHYGDAVVREVDRSFYFAQQEQQQVPSAQQDKEVRATEPSTVVIDGESYVEVSLDNDLTSAEFAAFDAEASQVSAANAPTADAASRAPADTLTAGTTKEEKTLSEDPSLLVEDVEVDAADDAVAIPLTFGTTRPWFVPASGIVELAPLPPTDCALLLRFLLHLRQQTEQHLTPSLRRALQHAEEEEGEGEGKIDVDGQMKNSQVVASSAAASSSASAVPDASSSAAAGRRGSSSHPLTLADVIRYLDTAPPPVIGFTESLPSTSSSSSSSSSPAFVFHLYLENVSSQNAVGHLATLFGLPQRCFQTHSAVSKMSCTTVLCAVAENRLRREHLLLLNTMRHPGFVIRVSTIQEVNPRHYHLPASAEGNATTSAATAAGGKEAEGADGEMPPAVTSSLTQQLFGDLARWQPLYQTELLLRRVCSDKASGDMSTRQQLEHRLRAVQTLGAICFCANRESSLARAATDVLHGFFKSALLNALQRRKAPVPLQRFLKRPNVATAQHAHHVSTDATVRQVLKTFVQTNGDWHATVVRTPYVWRRRWINALRGLVWNTMASLRLRKGGRAVCFGDVVLKPEFRQDVHRRGLVTVKAEHVMVVTTDAEAEAAELEDVFLPFLRGRYPEHLFAAEATNHPVMTRTNMLALLRAMHAPQLLLGLTDDVRLILDVRAESSPLLFRRLLIRPVAMEFAILEDKPPMRGLHFDAARLLTNDRWNTAASAVAGAGSGTTAGQSSRTANNNSSSGSASVAPSASSLSFSAPAAVLDGTNSSKAAAEESTLFSPTSRHLLPPSDVLERTTLGARLSTGVLAEDFFSIPKPDDYVVLGHAHRHLHGGFVAAAPHTDTADVGDRVYTVYVRAVVEHNVAGLTNMLREYFLLSGIETEAESALQHKIHRMRRELDPETPLLTAPVYCTTCFNRDHDSQEQCAEYQFKVHRRAARRDLVESVVDGDAAVAPVTLPSSSTTRSGEKHEKRLAGSSGAKGGAETTMAVAAAAGNTEHAVLEDEEAAAPAHHTIRMRWHLRRRNDEQRWGVHLTKALHLVGMENVKLLREGTIWNAPPAEVEDGAVGKVASAMAMPDAAHTIPWPSSWITDEAANALASGQAAPEAQELSSAQPLLTFLASTFLNAKNDEERRSETLQDLLLQSPVLTMPLDPEALQLRTTAAGTSAAAPSPAEVLKACRWTLKLVNATPVLTQRDVAAALVQHAAKSRDVWLTFETTVDAAATTTATPLSTTTHHAAPSSSRLPAALLASTHATNAIPQSTAALPPKRRHEVEVALRAALLRTSPATQRWLQDLPYRLTIALVKYRPHLHKHRSWGLQLDGTDMTLVNFARLMVQYMYVSDSVERRRRLECALVASVAPAASFPRNDPAMATRLFDEVLPALEPLLNDMYRVVRIDNTPVHHKAEAARAMAAFQVKMDEKIAARGLPHSRGGGHEDVGNDGEDAELEVYLTLTLERKGSSYRLCAAAAAPSETINAPSTPTVSDARVRSASAPLPHAETAAASSSLASPVTTAGAGSPDASSTQEARDAATPSMAVPTSVEAELLDGLSTAQCPVHPLTSAQLTRSSVTLAINRLLLTEQTANKWGLRLQHGTRRLKAVQQNRFFSFHVFAAKQSQGTRIADTLRLVSTNTAAAAAAARAQPHANEGDSDAALLAGPDTSSTSVPATHVITRSFYVYMVERVNQQAVRDHAELRRELFRAAQPLTSDVAAVSALPPESVTLGVRQFPLLRFTATVRRGGVGEGSALSPVGLQVDKNMSILSVFAGSPMARALVEAVGPLSSARRLIQQRDGGAGGSVEVEDTADGNAKDASAGGGSTWQVIALPTLRTCMAAVENALRRSSSSKGSQRGSKRGAQKSERPSHQWAYDLDEDADSNAGADEKTVDRRGIEEGERNAKATSSTAPSPSELTAALRALADAAALTYQQLGKCSMVDGVHLLQASLLHEYAMAQLAALGGAGGGEGKEAPASAHEAMARLREELQDVYGQLRWEVVYAARSNRPLRTPADLAAAFAPGVAEESISIQQFVED